MFPPPQMDKEDLVRAPDSRMPSWWEGFRHVGRSNGQLEAFALDSEKEMEEDQRRCAHDVLLFDIRKGN